MITTIMVILNNAPAKVNGDGDVGHPDHREVEPVPSVSQVGEALKGKT